MTDIQLSHQDGQFGQQQQKADERTKQEIEQQKNQALYDQQQAPGNRHLSDVKQQAAVGYHQQQ